MAPEWWGRTVYRVLPSFTEFYRVLSSFFSLFFLRWFLTLHWEFVSGFGAILFSRCCQRGKQTKKKEKIEKENGGASVASRDESSTIYFAASSTPSTSFLPSRPHASANRIDRTTTRTRPREKNHNNKIDRSLLLLGFFLQGMCFRLIKEWSSISSA